MENKTKFYVIEFEKLPTEDYDKYVCVPRSWVLGQANDKLAFKYPLEKMSITNKRIAEGDCPSEEWPLYLETWKYETDSLSNAKQFRCLMEKSFNKTRRRSSQVNAKTAKTPIKPTVTNKEIHDNLNSGNETEESDDERMDEDQFEKHDPRKSVETHGNGKNAVRRGSTGGSRDNQAPIRRSSTGGSRDNQAPNIRRKSTEGRRDSQAPNIRRNSTEGRRDSQAPNIRRNSTESRRDNQAQNNPSISDTTLNDSHAIHIISTTLQHLVKEMKRQNDNIEKFHQDFIVNRDVTLQNAMLLKEIAKKLMINTDCLKRPLSDSDDKVKENNTPAPIQSGTITKRRKSVRIQEDQERTECGKSEENTPKKQYIRPFSLPREYDPKDSRWTLRYREMGPGLEELKKNSGVYIDSIRFENCKRLARDEKTLARLLLVEIFTDQALGTCSLTGARAKAFDPDGTNTRPGLDERARNVLLNFVEEHCHEKRWQSSEKQSIMNTLRNKMQEIRSRYVK